MSSCKVQIHILEVGNDLVATVRNLFVLFGGSLDDLETVCGVEAVTGVCASPNLAAIQAVADDLCYLSVC